MAIVTNTQLTANSVGNREDLHDKISMISPSETPLVSLLSDRDVKAVKHEWLIDDLAAPSTSNAQLEGDTYTYSAHAAPDRVSNICQIFRKTQIISKTQEVVDKAGRKSEVAYQKAKMGLELRTDMEVTYLSNQASVAGNASTARRLGGLRAWLASNDSLGSGGASGGYNSGTGVVDAATNGTQRAFTKTLLDDTIQNTYEAGGSPTVLMVSPYVKRVFSTFMSDSNVAQLRMQTRDSQATLVGAADAYLSDFGLIDVVPNRQMARLGAAVARNAFLLDRSKAHKGNLRRIQDVSKTADPNADGQPIVMLGECTLIVDNEAAHGVIADLFGMSAAA